MFHYMQINDVFLMIYSYPILKQNCVDSQGSIWVKTVMWVLKNAKLKLAKTIK